MDSLTQLVLGASVSVAVMRRSTSIPRAAAWGAVAGTLPDLDVFIDHGDPILNMVLHRAESHALLYLALLSLPMALLVSMLHRETPLWWRWWIALALALLTHPLLDLMTVYGTQLLIPFTREPYGVGSVFIIDPLVTLPLLLGVAWAVVVPSRRQALKGNLIGLSLAVAYLGWGAAVQLHVAGQARESLRAQGLPAERVLVTPTPFNTVLWRIVAVGGGQYHEGFHSLLDAPGPIRFDSFDQGAALAGAVAEHQGLARIRRFSDGFWAVKVQGDRLTVADLRMGQEPGYAFRFAIASRAGPEAPWVPLAVPESVGGRGAPGPQLRWLGRRLLGEPLPPPR